jgi:hypothetical protein
MTMRKLASLGMLLLTAVLAGCGGGEDNAFGNPATGGGPGGTPTPASLTVVTSAPTIPSDGSATASITAFVRDASNALIPNVTVTFEASSGGVAPATARSDASGEARTTLSTAGDPALRTITVTARAGGLTNFVNVQVVPSASSNIVRMGSGSGAGFVQGVLQIATPSLAAGGTTSVSANLVNADGSLYTQPVTVTFNSPCVAAGTAQIQPAATATTSSGLVTVTYAARGCSGPDTITASATVGGQSLSATGTVTVAPAAVGSIAFVSATPTNIALSGTGDARRPESSTVVFEVRDSTGGPVPNAAVSFTLNTSVGGISITPTSAVSDAQGRVQTVVSAGTVATSVNVTATVTSVTPNISTQSSQLTVTTGIPTAGSFSLSAQCFNIEGRDFDGVTTAITARLGDRFQNPVPDGTAVTFTAEGGNVQSQCTTTTTATEGGVCTVNLRSSEPRPPNGRITVLAKAIGEESFVDANGNGAFDNGETFTDQAEPFRDDNEDGAYQVGEDFFDFNNNQTRDGPDGLFNGVLCNDTTGRCGGPATRSAGIGRSLVVIFSGSTPLLSRPDGTPLPATFAVGGTNSAANLTVWVRDINGNPMPSGTTVTLAASGAGLGIANPSSYTVPCSNIASGALAGGVTIFPFTVTSGTSVGQGVLTLTITTPRGLVTTQQISATVP